MFSSQPAGAGLVPKNIQHAGIGTDKGQAGSSAVPGEIGVLTKEAVTRMNGVAALFQCNSNKLSAVQISPDPAAAQRNCDIRFAHMKGA